jgi:predicted nucleotidyltransferase
MIASVVADRREEIEALCARYHVRRLEVFGSATRDDFDPDRSDIDFLVEFQSLAPVRHARCYFGLLEALQSLLERHVDLVEIPALDNPYFIAAIKPTREVVYAD